MSEHDTYTIISRKEARERGLTKYFTGKACPRNHISKRYVSDTKCIQCVSEKGRALLANPEKHAAKLKRRKESRNTPEAKAKAKKYFDTKYPQVKGKVREYNKVYYADNKALYQKLNAAWWERNKGTTYIKDKRRKWLQDNKAHVTAYNAIRRTLKLKCIPKWADLTAIDKIYEDCKRITEETGIKHHVDHYYPLKSSKVCGLHVIENLRIITASENLKKKNKMPE